MSKIIIIFLFVFIPLNVKALSISVDGKFVYDNGRNITWVADANLFKTLADNYIDGPAAYVQSIINANNGIIFDIPNGSDGNDGIYDLSGGDFNTITGQMTWFGAMAWVNALDYGGYSDWRLPYVIDTDSPGCNMANNGTDCGYNVDTAGSELAYLYYDVLGKKGAYDTNDQYHPGFGIFDNGNAGYNISDSIGPFINVRATPYFTVTEYSPNPNYAWYFSSFSGVQIVLPKNFQEYVWIVRDGIGAVSTVPEPTTAWLIVGALLGLFGFKRHVDI